MGNARHTPLSFLTLFSLGVNGIVGVGIFLAPPVVARAIPGGWGAVLPLLVGLLCLPIALTYARLSRAFQLDGGPVLYARAAFGAGAADAVGSLCWLSAVFSTSAVTVALAEVLAPVVHLRKVAIIPVIAVVLLLTNLRSLRISSLAWSVLTVLKVAPLLIVVALAPAGQFANSEPLAISGLFGRLGSAVLTLLFALQGFEIVSLPAGEAQPRPDSSEEDPPPEGQNLDSRVALATVGSLLFSCVLYAGIQFAVAGSVPSLKSSTTPIADAALALGGSTLHRAVSWGVGFSVAGITVGMFAMTPRYLAALRILPLAGSHIVTAVLVLALATAGNLGELVDLSSLSVLGQYGSTAVALLTLSRGQKFGLRPRDGWIAAPSLLVVVLLVAASKTSELLVGVGVTLVGCLLLALVRRKRARG